MNPPHTYTNKFGIYYFRLKLPNNSTGKRTEIRFSLKTTVSDTARSRAYRAWLCAKSIPFSEFINPTKLRSTIQLSAFGENNHAMTRTVKTYFGPELVKLVDIADSYDVNRLQQLIGQALGKGIEIFAPFNGDQCQFFPIPDPNLRGSPEYDEGLNYPIHIDGDGESTYSAEIVLTNEGMQSALDSKNGNFKVDEFYSYYLAGWTRDKGFKARINPFKPLLLVVSQLLIAKEKSDSLDTRVAPPSSAKANVPDDARELVSEKFRKNARQAHKLDDWTDKNRAEYTASRSEDTASRTDCTLWSAQSHTQR